MTHDSHQGIVRWLALAVERRLRACCDLRLAETLPGVESAAFERILGAPALSAGRQGVGSGAPPHASGCVLRQREPP